MNDPHQIAAAIDDTLDNAIVALGECQKGIARQFLQSGIEKVTDIGYKRGKNEGWNEGREYERKCGDTKQRALIELLNRALPELSHYPVLQDDIKAALSEENEHKEASRAAHASEIVCPECGHKYEYEQESRGYTQCPKCKADRYLSPACAGTDEIGTEIGLIRETLKTLIVWIAQSSLGVISQVDAKQLIDKLETNRI